MAPNNKRKFRRGSSSIDGHDDRERSRCTQKKGLDDHSTAAGLNNNDVDDADDNAVSTNSNEAAQREAEARRNLVSASGEKLSASGTDLHDPYFGGTGHCGGNQGSTSRTENNIRGDGTTGERAIREYTVRADGDDALLAAGEDQPIDISRGQDGIGATPDGVGEESSSPCSAQPMQLSSDVQSSRLSSPSPSSGRKRSLNEIEDAHRLYHLPSTSTDRAVVILTADDTDIRSLERCRVEEEAIRAFVRRRLTGPEREVFDQVAFNEIDYEQNIRPVETKYENIYKEYFGGGSEDEDDDVTDAYQSSSGDPTTSIDAEEDDANSENSAALVSILYVILLFQ